MCCEGCRGCSPGSPGLLPRSPCRSCCLAAFRRLVGVPPAALPPHRPLCLSPAPPVPSSGCGTRARTCTTSCLKRAPTGATRRSAWRPSPSPRVRLHVAVAWPRCRRALHRPGRQAPRLGWRLNAAAPSPPFSPLLPAELLNELMGLVREHVRATPVLRTKLFQVGRWPAGWVGSAARRRPRAAQPPSEPAVLSLSLPPASACPSLYAGQLPHHALRPGHGVAHLPPQAGRRLDGGGGRAAPGACGRAQRHGHAADHRTQQVRARLNAWPVAGGWHARVLPSHPGPLPRVCCHRNRAGARSCAWTLTRWRSC